MVRRLAALFALVALFACRSSAPAIRGASVAALPEPDCPDDLVPIDVHGWSDDESAVVYALHACAIPEGEIRGDGYAVDRAGVSTPLIAYENKPDGLENWLLVHRARPTYEGGPKPKSGPGGIVLGAEPGCTWQGRTVFCDPGPESVRLFVAEGGARKVSAMVKNGPDGVWLTPWWSPSQRNVAWAGSWGRSVACPRRYFVVLGAGRSQGIEVPLRYQSPLGRFRLDAEVLGWMGDSFVYRVREQGGTYSRQDAFIARERGLETFPEEFSSDIDLMGDVGRADREAARASLTAALKAHPVTPPLNVPGVGGREITISVAGKPLPWSTGSFTYAPRQQRAHVKVTDGTATLAEWDIETGTEGGSIAPYWTADGKALSLMHRRWKLRFSGLVRLSDGESITVTVKPLP